jgi:D-lactate dehydrogenase
MKATIFNTLPFEKEALLYHNQQKHILHFVDEPLNEASYNQARGSQAVILCPNDVANKQVLEKLFNTGIHYIALRSVGYDNVDLKKAKALGMRVSYVPDYSPYSIAEHSVALMMALNRKIIQAHHNILNNNFSLNGLMGFDFNEKTVGIIGMGKVGRLVAKIMAGFGCKIIAYDHKSEQPFAHFNIQYESINTLFQKSDIISLHCPLTEETKHLINKDSISQMKDGVMLINTARGGIVNTLDLIEGLKSGKIGYAGLDVYENEKGLFFYDHSDKLLLDDTFARLLTFKNVLITGHQAFLTQEAIHNIARSTIYNLDCYQNNEESANALV